VRFACIEAEKAIPVSLQCRTLRVSRSGFYAWRGRPESAHAVEDRRLGVLVKASFDGSRGRYGSPRIYLDLVDWGVHISKKRIVRLMQEADLVARRRKRFKTWSVAENDQPIPGNVLDRRFEAEAPNQRWVGDTTELVIGASGSRLFLAVIMDLFSRIVVGWAMSAVNNRHLVIRALDMALLRRGPKAGLLHHTDQGSPYASEDYMRLLGERGIECSMSRRGNCHDNAAMEAFFSTLEFKVGTRFETTGHAKRELFDFIELFYNQTRRHSTAGNVSPAEFERRARTTQVA
jgi:putative transposase